MTNGLKCYTISLVLIRLESAPNAPTCLVIDGIPGLNFLVIQLPSAIRKQQRTFCWLNL